jgi:hypothetical protein
MTYELITDESYVYIKNYFLHPNYQNKHKKYSRRIFDSLYKKYKKPLVLECFEELIPFYEKCGFLQWTPHASGAGLYEMILDPSGNY